ncbi:hypothetical protein Ahy_B06g082168 [Arachis hypogaea]|uniref:SWIM-type domain-containing protein n=1 Tax=Arachis hypogaea TaxID=3818 RepID=A0A444YMY6_ARAHY|nr:hypothetical protein Ahy_B06g082168 [Arachis hypogaea]
MSVADPKDGEFRIRMEYNSRKSVVVAIRSYIISRGVDYNIYESKPQTFYAKCKTYSCECNWLIRASLIRKISCWEIRRYNGRHTYTMGTISQDHSKHIDSNFLWAFKVPHLKKLVVNIGYSRTVEEYNIKAKHMPGVDLGQQTCDCGHFQVKRIPCRHRLDWQVYVNDVYKMTEVCEVYRIEFIPLDDLETWPAYPGPKLVANPTFRRISKGRPKLTRYPNEMDSREMCGPRICHVYGRRGYSRSRHPQRAGLSGVGDSVTSPTGNTKV